MQDFNQQLTQSQVWDFAKAEISKIVDSDNFANWFAPISLLSSDEDTYILGVNDEFTALWLKENYVDLIRRNIAMILGSSVQVEIKTLDTSENLQPVAIPERPVYEIAKPKAILPSNIISSNTFDSFVIGEGNSFAHAAALAVASKPGQAHNLLCIYGSTGLGKTHLMHAIAHFIFGNNPTSKIVYTSSERFTNEFVEMVKTNSLAQFRKRYREVDVLLIDDVQFFAGKERTQEEFFHTFCDLFHAGKQIVLTSDRPLNEIQDIQERLISRFEWGLSADIQSPDYETRIAILSKKMSALNIEISNEILDMVARKITKNVRRLEGALNKLAGYVSLLKGSLSVEKAQELLADTFRSEEDDQNLSISSIQEATAKYFQIDSAEIIGRRRPANIALARQIAMYISKRLTNHTLEEIGRQFGNRDHGTVIHAIKVIGALMENDRSVKGSVEYLLKTFNS